MTDSSLSSAPSYAPATSGVVARVLRAALTVFVLDGLYVIVVFVWIRGVTTVERMFQGIASAVLGPPAVIGGWSTAALGILLHFSVALGWSVVWMMVYEQSRRLRRLTNVSWRAVLIGALYGLFVWLAMHFIVLPLTLSKPGALFTFGSMLVGLAHVLVVGPPIVLLGRRRLAAGSA